MKILSSLFLTMTIICLVSCGGGDNVRYAEIVTEFGTMKVELYDSTPKHKENFIKLVEEGFYDDLLFHRVMNQFMVQGGDPNSKDAPPGGSLGTGGPGYTIDAEIGAPHFKGALAAARQPDGVNPEKKSSGSQFYVVHGRPQNEQGLQRTAASKGITYNESQMKKYMELGGYPPLDMEYTVFGEVVEGLDVIDKIAVVAVDSRNRPNEDIKMTVRMLN